MYDMIQLSLKTQDFLYGSMWKFSMKIPREVHRNGNTTNERTFEMDHTLDSRAISLVRLT
jgi:hypothetical protein